MDNNPYSFFLDDKSLYLVKTIDGSPTYSPLVPAHLAEQVMDAMAVFLAAEDFGEIVT